MDMGMIYGEILLDEILVDSVQSADSSEVYWDVDIAVDHAKIWGPNWWVSVLGPDTTIDYENALQNGIIGIAAAWDGQMDSVSNTIDATGGFEAGYSIPDIASIELSLFSLNDWTDVTGSSKTNAYGMKASVALTAVENLALEAAVNLPFGDFTKTTAGADAVYGWLDDMGTPADTTDDVALVDTAAATGTPYWGVVTAAAADTVKVMRTGLGGKLAYTIGLGAITVTPEVGVDVVLLDSGANIGIGNGIRIATPGAEITGAEDGIKDDAGTSVAWDDGVNSGLTLGWDYYMPAVGDASLGVQAHYGMSMIENFQLALGIEAADVLDSNADMGMALWTKYTMGDIAPWAGFFMVFDGKMIANAGLTWSNIVPLTTFTLDWRSGDLSLADPDLGIFKASVKVAY
jgi:hypothetical protein